MHDIQSMPWLDETWRRLVQWEQQKRLPHALLMIGSKVNQSFAQAFAHQLLCQESLERPCQQCQGCRWFAQNHHPDYCALGLETEDIIGVDAIRQLQPFVHMKPETHQKVVVLNADRLNVSSSNALLKMLEEPQANVCFLLTTEHPSQLPATISSRCVPISLPKPSPEQSVAFLQNALSCSEQDAQNLLFIAQGCPVHALDFKESASIFEEVVSDLWGLAKRTADPLQVAAAWCQTLLEDKLYLCYALLNRLYTKEVPKHLEHDQLKRFMTLDTESNQALWQLSQKWYPLMAKVQQPGVKAEYQVSSFLMDWQQAVK